MDRAAETTAARAHFSTRGVSVSVRALCAALVWAVVAGNAVVIVWLWVHGGNLSVHDTGEAFTSVARITGLLSAVLREISTMIVGGV